MPMDFPGFFWAHQLKYSFTDARRYMTPDDFQNATMRNRGPNLLSSSHRDGLYVHCTPRSSASLVSHAMSSSLSRRSSSL